MGVMMAGVGISRPAAHHREPPTRPPHRRSCTRAPSAAAATSDQRLSCRVRAAGGGRERRDVAQGGGGLGDILAGWWAHRLAHIDMSCHIITLNKHGASLRSHWFEFVIKFKRGFGQGWGRRGRRLGGESHRRSGPWIGRARHHQRGGSFGPHRILQYGSETQSKEAALCRPAQLSCRTTCSHSRYRGCS